MSNINDVQITHKENGKWNGLIHSYDKSTKKYQYTTIADRLRMVSWSDHSYTTGVV